MTPNPESPSKTKEPNLLGIRIVYFGGMASMFAYGFKMDYGFLMVVSVIYGAAGLMLLVDDHMEATHAPHQES